MDIDGNELAGSNDFPNLKPEDFDPVSEESEQYNCLAWAAGVNTEWWEPSVDGVWPDWLAQDLSPETLIRLYESLGYERCDSSAREPGFEKIVIYGDQAEYEHAARQLPDGTWTSKLGLGIDINHKTVECLAGGPYGAPLIFLKRRFHGRANEG